MLLNKKHITYCSNIFHEKSTQKLLFKLMEYVSFIRTNLKKKKFGLGLCLSNNILKNLSKKKNLKYLNEWMQKNNLYISSINGFVYTNFHQKNIKEKIYYPDWSTKKRFNYTKNIIEFIKKNETKINDISISTSPVSFKKWVKKHDQKYILFYSSISFVKLLKVMIIIKNNTHKHIHLDIEPEPACLIESIKDFIDFYFEWVKKNANYYLKNTYPRINYHTKQHINLCYDICHFSVNYEKHEDVIKIIKEKKIKIGKVQISSAIEIASDKNNLINLKKELKFLTTSQFLHQNTTIDVNNNIVNKNTDIEILLNSNFLNTKTRIHCHMPIYLDTYKEKLNTTQKDTKNALTHIMRYLNVKHLELESYTYDMILKKEKFQSILKEYLLLINWIKKNV